MPASHPELTIFDLLLSIDVVQSLPWDLKENNPKTLISYALTSNFP